MHSFLRTFCVLFWIFYSQLIASITFFCYHIKVFAFTKSDTHFREVNMLETIEKLNSAVNNFIWGVPAMICIIGVGLYLSIRTNFLQIRKFPYAIKTTIGRMFKKKEASDGSIISGCLYRSCGNCRYG